MCGVIIYHKSILTYIKEKIMEVASKDVFKLIQELEEVIDTSSTGVFNSRKISIDKDFLMEKLNDIKIALLNQFKHVDYIYKEKDKILDDAKAEAEDILEKTREYARQKKIGRAHV